MPKIRKSYRIDSDVLDMLHTLLPFISAEKGIKLNETMLLELLVSERYARLLKDSEGGANDV